MVSEALGPRPTLVSYLSSNALCGPALPDHQICNIAHSLLWFDTTSSAGNACPSSSKPIYSLCFSSILASSLRNVPKPLHNPTVFFSWDPILFCFYCSSFVLFCFSMHSVLCLSLPDSQECQLLKYRHPSPLFKAFLYPHQYFTWVFANSLNKWMWNWNPLESLIAHSNL